MHFGRAATTASRPNSRTDPVNSRVRGTIVLGSACSMKMEMGRAMNSRLRDA